VEKKTAAIIGLIGGIIAAVGVFLPWYSAGIAGVITVNVSGWDATAMTSAPYIILLGGVLALLGGLGLLANQKALGYLVPIGGIVAILGWAYAVADAGTLSGFAYGFYACLVGGIIALIGSLGLKGE